MVSTLKKSRKGIDSVDIYPSPPRLHDTDEILFTVCEVLDEYRVNIQKMEYRIEYIRRYFIQGEIDSTVYEVLDVYRVTLQKMYCKIYVWRWIIQMRCIVECMQCGMYTESLLNVL